MDNAAQQSMLKSFRQSSELASFKGATLQQRIDEISSKAFQAPPHLQMQRIRRKEEENEARKAEKAKQRKEARRLADAARKRAANVAKDGYASGGGGEESDEEEQQE